MLAVKNRPDRWEYALRQCERAGIRPLMFWGHTPANMDGCTFTDHARSAMGKTEICAAQGHADILKLVAASQNPYLVIEDDVTWTAKNAGAMIRALIRALPKDWSIAFLDDVNHETHKLEQSPESEEMASPWARTLWSAYGIPAYLVSPAGAARLLEVLLPINTPVDVLYAYQAQYISAWMLRVPIATANWSLPSTIWQNGKAL